MAIVNALPVQKQIWFVNKATSNKSFLDMHYFLKERGIKNNDFFLVLHDTGLAGVDPRDPNLPRHMKLRVLKECQINYWYYLRDVLRIPEQGGAVGNGTRYKLNRANLAMGFLFQLNFNMYVELPRQFGKTTAALARYLWVYNFGTSNSEIMFMHKDHQGSKDNLKNLKAYRDALPTYLQLSAEVAESGKKLKVPNTAIMVQHIYNNNRIVTKPSARTKDAANNLGRGSTIPLIYYDEFAFMPWNEEVYLAAAPAFSRASQTAKRNGVPYGMLITSTPGDLLTDAGMFAYSIRNNATPWREDFYDYTYEQLVGLAAANTKSTFFLVCYSYKQLGEGQEYLNRMIQQMEGKWDKIRREVLLEWAESPTECPFSQEDLETIKGYCRQPIRSLAFGQFGQYRFDIYKDIDLSYPPIIGVDVAGSTFRDSSAITIIDSHTTEVCACLNCNFMPADDLADVLYQLVTNYMPNGIINCERNGGFGIAVVQRLCKTSVKKNLYWEVKDKVIEESMQGTRMQKVNRKVKVYGTDSTKAVRARLIEILMERVMYHKDKFVSPIIYEEMRSMEIKKSGKVEHSDKTHDDQVFSYLMALYVWYEGKNLIENFGIRKSTLKTDQNDDVSEDVFEDSIEKKERMDYNAIIRDDIDTEKLNEINADLEWLQSDKFITSDQFADMQKLELYNGRNRLAYNDKKAAQAMMDSVTVGVILNPVESSPMIYQTSLPDSLFRDDDYGSFDLDDYDAGGRPLTDGNGVPLAGNLSSFYNNL